MSNRIDEIFKYRKGSGEVYENRDYIDSIIKKDTFSSNNPTLSTNRDTAAMYSLMGNNMSSCCKLEIHDLKDYLKNSKLMVVLICLIIALMIAVIALASIVAKGKDSNDANNCKFI